MKKFYTLFFVSQLAMSISPSAQIMFQKMYSFGETNPTSIMQTSDNGYLVSGSLYMQGGGAVDLGRVDVSPLGQKGAHRDQVTARRGVRDSIITLRDGMNEAMPISVLRPSR